MILGPKTPGADPVELDAATVYLLEAAPDGEIVCASVLAHLAGGAADSQVRPVVYDDVRLVATGPEVTIAQAAPAGWVDLPLDAFPVVSSVRFGVHVSAAVGGRAEAGGDHLAAAAPFATGAPDPLPAAIVETGTPTLALQALRPFAAPDLDDTHLARLPWQEAQRALGETGPVGPGVAAVCGWHHTETDPERGANAIARADGPLAHLVGERLRITSRHEADCYPVVVYCHTEQTFPPEAAREDLSLTRRAFLELGPLAADELDVVVEVLS